jgi:uncharacterized protein
MLTANLSRSVKGDRRLGESRCSMTFAILGFDGPHGQARRQIHRPAHLARLEQLESQGRLVLAGPFTDKAGSLILIEADSLADAEAFAKEDPYVIHEIFSRVEVHPFLQALPKARVLR